MKDREKEEVKEIVKEAMKEEKEKASNEVKKEKKKNKKIIIIASIVSALLLGLAVLFFFLFIFKPSYTVKVNDGGGKILKNIVVEDNVVKSLPEYNPPEGKRLVTWVNKKGEAVRPGIVLDDDDEFDPIVGDPIPEPGNPNPGTPTQEFVTLSFDSKTGEVIPDIIIPKGSEVILPVKPNPYKDWKFLFWVYHDDYVVLQGTKIYQDTHIEAYWWVPTENGPTEEVTIKYNTGTDEKIDSVTVPKGNPYIFKTPTKQKDNLKFKGWLDDTGKLLTSEDKVYKDITLTAKWVEPYTCPENCTPNADGTTCTRTTVVAPSSREYCPGTEYNNGYATYCVDVDNVTDDDCVRQCSDGYPFGDDEVFVEMYRYLPQFDAEAGGCCAKKLDRVTEYSCPEGYERDGDNCKLVETISCTQN